MSKIMVIDTETGGLNNKVHSLLSVGIAVFENGVEVYGDTFYHRLNEYCATPEAMNINRLDLSMVKEHGLTTESLCRKVYSIIKPENDNTDIIFLGHNLQFDANFLGTLDPHFVHHVMRNHIDTKALALHLYLQGKLPERKTGLADLCNYFGIESDGHHEALVDARMTYRLYLALSQL